MEMDPKLTFAAGVMATVVFALIKEVWSSNKSEIKSLRNSIQQATLAIQALTIEMRFVHEKLEVIPEMKKDLDGLGEKVRVHLSQ